LYEAVENGVLETWAILVVKLLSRKYLKNSDGGMAINFALGITALLIGVGAAIDVNLMTSQKSKL